MSGVEGSFESSRHIELSSQLVSENIELIDEFMRGPWPTNLDFNLVPWALRLGDGRITDPKTVAEVARRTLLGLRGHYSAQNLITWRRQRPSLTEITYWQLISPDEKTYFVVETDETAENWSYVSTNGRKAHITRNCPFDYSRMLQNQLEAGVAPTQPDHISNIRPGLTE